MLSIKKYNEPFDFQLPGNDYNWRAGISFMMRDRLLSFHFFINYGQALTIFEARKVEIFYDKVQIIETIDLTANMPTHTENRRYELLNTVLIFCKRSLSFLDLFTKE